MLLFCFEQDTSLNYMTDKTAQVTIEALCNNFKEKYLRMSQHLNLI
nr:MAG TPA: hypothetical protein [Caudoviricetes sp.]